MEFKPKIISTDFDGTIFQEFETPPVPRSLETRIGELQSFGCKWVVNTGRDIANVIDCFARAHLGILPDFLVTVEREIYTRSNGKFEPVTEWNSKCYAFHNELFARVQPYLPDLSKWISSNYKAILYSDGYSPLCVIADNNQVMDKIEQHLLEFCKTIPGLDVMRNDVYARFCHIEFNKGTALKEISRMLGIEPTFVVSAGDHYNDIPMLNKQIAHWLVAPSNAVQKVKDHVLAQNGYVSSLPAGFGVLDAINYFSNNHA